MPGELTNTVCTVEMVLPAYGGDLLVANAGRVSYDRWHDELTARDLELIRQFAEEDDTSVFYHSVATFRITCPIPVLEQLTRHNPGFSPVVKPNQLSRRYTSRNIVVHSPLVWRRQDGTPIPFENQQMITAQYASHASRAMGLYEGWIEAGMSREQARFILPMGLMTTALWTGNLYAWRTLCKKRLDPRAQPETQAVAEHIAAEMAAAFPVAWPALMEAE